MKAALFDLDETILDRTESLREFALWQARGMLRNSVLDETEYCKRFVELDMKGLVWKDTVYTQLIDEFNITDWSAPELLQNYMLCFSGFCIAKKNAIDSLKALAEEGFYLGLVSNGKSPFQERNFNALGVSHLFSTVVISDAVGYRKPEKEIFDLACSSLGVPAEETVFVGDNPDADINGANICGMYTVFVPGAHGEKCRNANATCTDFSNLVRIIKNAI